MSRTIEQLDSSDVKQEEFEDVERKMICLGESAREIRDSFLCEIKGLIEMIWPDAKLFLFGSAANDLISDNNMHDLDICVLLPSQNSKFRQETSSLIVKLEQHLRSQAAQMYDDTFELSSIPNARIPIVRMIKHYKVTKACLQCDICVNNLAALWNTELIRYWLGISDNRDRNIVYYVSLWLRHWLKSIKADKDSQVQNLTSYGLQLLILYFFHQKYPAIISSIDCSNEYQQQERHFATNEIAISEFEMLHIHNVIQEKASANELKTESNYQITSRNIARILSEFFKFYAFEFDWITCKISLRFPSKVPAKTKSLSKRNRSDFVLQIEDPIEIERDLGDLLKKNERKEVHLQLIRSCFQISNVDSIYKSLEVFMAMLPKELKGYNQKEGILNESVLCQ